MKIQYTKLKASSTQFCYFGPHLYIEVDRERTYSSSEMKVYRCVNKLSTEPATVDPLKMTEM